MSDQTMANSEAPHFSQVDELEAQLERLDKIVTALYTKLMAVSTVGPDSPEERLHTPASTRFSGQVNTLTDLNIRLEKFIESIVL